jgi:hypothetical protein
MPALEVALTLRRPRETVAAEELIFEASVANSSDDPVRFNALQAAYPALVLEVEGPSGQRVLLPPPGSPSEEAIMRLLELPG